MPRTAALLFLVLVAPPWHDGARASEIKERVVKVPVRIEDTYRKVIERFLLEVAPTPVNAQ
jgi:hypothetical protein